MHLKHRTMPWHTRHYITNISYEVMKTYAPVCFFNSNFFQSSPEDMFNTFRERGWERERKKEKHREWLIHCLMHKAWPGIECTTNVCALTNNWTHNLLVYLIMLQPVARATPVCFHHDLHVITTLHKACLIIQFMNCWWTGISQSVHNFIHTHM